MMLPADQSRKIIRQVVADAAQHEQPRSSGSRHELEHVGALGEVGRLRKRLMNQAMSGLTAAYSIMPSTPSMNMPPVRPRIAQQPAIDRHGVARGARRRASRRLGAPAARAVAKLRRANPSCPSTSIAVTTDWCVARPSARRVTGASRSLGRDLQDGGAQRVGARIDQLAVVDQIGAAGGHRHHQRRGLGGRLRHRARTAAAGSRGALRR